MKRDSGFKLPGILAKRRLNNGVWGNWKWAESQMGSDTNQIIK
jgi:hypothetical protein